MSRGVTAYIARRFMLAKKHRRSVGVVTGVSVAGIAVATMAMVCVLSVYNGFDRLLGERLSAVSPDISVAPASGKTLHASGGMLDTVGNLRGVASVSPELCENALAVTDDGRQFPVLVRGVEPDAYARTTPVRSLILPGGAFSLTDPAEAADDEFDFDNAGAASGYATGTAVAGVGVAANLDLRPGERVTLCAPRRLGRIYTASPATAFRMRDYTLAGVFRTDQKEFDMDEVLVGLTGARELFQYTDEATGLRVALEPGADAAGVCAEIERLLPGVRAKDRLAQHELNYRMINIEKWVTFLLLAFILTVASFNVISSISMLALEKKRGLATLYCLGLTRRGIGRIFMHDSLYVMLAGGAAGIAAGVVLCLLQQHFGLIRLNADPDALIISAYPVAVRWSDLLYIAGALAAIGLATGLAGASYARSLLKANNSSPAALLRQD